MSSVVVIDCNDISSSRKPTLMELYQALAPSLTATPFVTGDIPHLWYKPGINILSEAARSSLQVLCFIGQSSR